MNASSDIESLTEASAALDASAMEAAQAFYSNYVKYGVGKYPSRDLRSGRNWSKFVQVARVCLSHGIPVTKFVDAAFAKALERHSVVTANDLCLKDPESVFKSKDGILASADPSDLWSTLSYKLVDTVFSSGNGADRLSVLDNPTYGFPAWFRVFSPKNPVPDILLHWGDLAFEELSEDHRLADFLSTKRPVIYSLLKSIIEKIQP